MNFWQELKKKKGDEPIIVIAPMADVTDAAFRRMFAKNGKPDVMWTEFVSADGLILGGEKARKALLPDLEFVEEERPIVAQLFTSNPKTMEKAAKLCADLGFDGIDINMGCPDRSIEKQGAGSAMIKTPKLARKIIKAAKKGAKGLPISVKTRLGYNKDQLEEWLPQLLKAKPAVITIHCRTRKEMSKVPARWERITRAVEIRNAMKKSETLIFGNGDVMSLEDAHDRAKETGCDGIMVGRGIFGNPWFFNNEIDRDKDVSITERLEVMVEHTKLYEKLLPHKNFAIMKKHYKAYVEGFDGARELRAKLFEANNSEEIEKIVQDFLADFGHTLDKK